MFWFPCCECLEVWNYTYVVECWMLGVRSLDYPCLIYCVGFPTFCQGPRNLFTYLSICRWERSACHVVSIWRSVSREDWIPISVFTRSVLDSIHQNHLGREGLRWNDGHLMTYYTEWKLSVIFVWENASKLFTQEMVYINLLFDCTVIKKFAQFYADISYI